MNEIVKYESALSGYLMSSGAPLLVFRQGDFSSGDTAIALGTRFATKPLEHQIGWQRWQDKKPAETRMGYLHEGFSVPDRSTLGFLDQSEWEIDQNNKRRDPWQSSETIPFIADDGEEFLFVTGSWGGHCALVKLQKAFRLDGSRRDPVSVNERPVFKVVGWVGAQPLLKAVKPPTTSEIVGDEIPF